MQALEEARRTEALLRLELFCHRILPGTIRRIAAWKGIGRGQIPDLTDELRQELALDCLQHADTVVQLPQAQRHSRWMRAAERWIYHHVLGRSHRGPMPDAPLAAERQQAPARADLISRPHVVVMGNGRLNLTASAAADGKVVRHLQQELEHLASDLGCDEHYHAFWRLRLAEALTGLAADLLRDRGAVRLARRHPAPDPGGRLRRIRRIAARFHVRPSTLEVRRVLRQWVRRPRLDEQAPRRLLEHATQLHPKAAAAWLWLFEACLVDRDLVAALRALRACRHLAACDPIASTLARARLLEARHQWQAATALIRRAKARWPRDSRLRRVHAAITGAAP